MSSNLHVLSVSDVLVVSGALLSLLISIMILAAFIVLYRKSKKILENRDIAPGSIKNPSPVPEPLKVQPIKKDMMDLVIFKKQALEEIDSVVMKVGCEMKSMNSRLEKILQQIEDDQLRDQIEKLFIKQNDRFLRILDHSKGIITAPDYSVKKYYSFKKMKETHLPKNIMELLLTGSAHSIIEFMSTLNEPEDHISACLDELIGLDIVELVSSNGTDQYRITEKGISYYLEQYD